MNPGVSTTMTQMRKRGGGIRQFIIALLIIVLLVSY